MIVKAVTLGCKVNQCESSEIVAALQTNGYNASEGLEPADVYILNTCSVTAEADKKSRQHLAKMRKLNPSCTIIVVGCSSQNTPEKFTEQPNVAAVSGTKNKSEFVLNYLNGIYKNNHYNTLSDIIPQDIVCNSIYKHNISGICGRTRVFIKIQDGCNRFCSYCIIPYLRGRSVSRPIADIVRECGEINSMEFVLTGIDISMYGLDNGESLAELLTALQGVPGRKRLGSLECEAVTDELLKAMSAGDCCPHFHLSLQSGSDEVLRAMNRKYDCGYYYEKVKSIRKHFPLAGITTDIIVGFPVETDELFKESCDFIEKCGFSDIHVFPYSSREGTLAARKYKMLPPNTVKERVEKLLAIKQSLRNKFFEKNLDTTASVYVEDSENGYNVGYTPNYIKVYSDAPCGNIVDIKLVSLYKDGVLGVTDK